MIEYEINQGVTIVDDMLNERLGCKQAAKTLIKQISSDASNSVNLESVHYKR